jgi:hypothetical protein
VRGQHPYAHPTAAVIPVGVAVGIVNVVATVAVAKRATTGISGRRRLLLRAHGQRVGETGSLPAVVQHECGIRVTAF